MRHALIASLKILCVTQILGSIAFLVMFYSDDIDGLIFAASQRAQNVTAAIGNSLDLAAVYIATNDPNLVTIRIVEGWRKEQIAEAFKEKLNWSIEQKYVFGEMLQCAFETSEGKLFPTLYTVPKDARPEDIKLLMMGVFEDKVSTSTVAIASTTPLNMDKIIVMASLIQREAAGKSDMNIVSGIMWNRLMNNMPLAIDATLQYIKGDERNWWPQVGSDDKYAVSAYNTYKNKGLPPHPIANPGLAAIAAAIRPAKTSCLYYIHDRYGRIHCSPTYSGHKTNIDLYLR
jgi:UPF0755 protein